MDTLNLIETGLIIIAIQCFFAGYYLADKMVWQRTSGERGRAYIKTFLMCFFGLPYIVLYSICLVFGALGCRLLNHFHLVFLFNVKFRPHSMTYDKDGILEVQKYVDARMKGAKWYSVRTHTIVYLNKQLRKLFKTEIAQDEI